jgi:hypothetical protein
VDKERIAIFGAPTFIAGALFKRVQQLKKTVSLFVPFSSSLDRDIEESIFVTIEDEQALIDTLKDVHTIYYFPDWIGHAKRKQKKACLS